MVTLEEQRKVLQDMGIEMPDAEIAALHATQKRLADALFSCWIAQQNTRVRYNDTVYEK